jgi:hypothetical protein
LRGYGLVRGSTPEYLLTGVASGRKDLEGVEGYRLLRFSNLF